MMSGHVDDHNVKFSDDMLAKLVKSRDANAGFLNRRQVKYRRSQVVTFADFLADLVGSL
jgi:hypothetical protein